MKSIDVAPQLPLEPDLSFSPNNLIIISNTTAPENSRITVKLDASMDLSPNANRQKMEFAAKAKSAKVVVNNVFAIELFDINQTPPIGL
jgi:hypothetical protein